MTFVDGQNKPSLAKVAFAVSSWFGFNVAMASLTKWIYLYAQVCSSTRGDVSCVEYKFPFMITAVHMLFSWSMSLIMLRRRAKESPKGARLVLGFNTQVRKVVPLAVVFSTSVVCGNLSLKFIYPSFNQMLASASPLITVIMSVIVIRKRYNSWTWLSMPVICGGLLVCGSMEVNYNVWGVVFVVAATALRALKSVIQEKLLDPREQQFDSVSLLYYMAPWAGCFLLTMSFVFEGLAPFQMLLPSAEKTGSGFLSLMLVASGVNACCLNISMNYVTAYTGAVMSQILGNVKACLSIIVSAAIFGNTVTPGQTFGVMLCLGGVWLYQQKGGVAKTSHLRQSTRDPAV